MPSVLDILRPQVVRGMMNEIKTPYDRFQDFFGLSPNGPACAPSETRSVSYDVVNDDRTVGNFSAPGADATRIAALPIGNRPTTCPRHFEGLELSYETLNNIRGIGRNADPGSQAGLSYVRQQMGHQLRRTRRWREFLIWSALRGTCQILVSGNTWVPVLTGGNVTLDWQLSANHKNQLNGIIDTSWDNAAANIITDLGQICAQGEADSGLPIRHAWCNTTRMITILNCTQVKNMGGSANTAFEQWAVNIAQMKSYGGADTDIDSWKIEQTVVLKGFPAITWHVTDRIISVNGSTTKFFADDEVLFHPDPDVEWIRGFEVKESTNQLANASPVDVYGYGSWIKRPVDSDVPRYVMYSLDNFFPAVNPNAYFFADVVP